MGGLRTRDTDADWRRIGDTEPFWGVSSHREYLRDELDDAARAALYDSGRLHIEAIAQDVERDLGAPLRAKSALDYGCGVGRLSEAMTGFADAVTGYDISSGMLEVARARTSAVTYADVLPPGPFDWINSALVFQHIAPERGLAELEALLQRLAPQGVVSLQFTVWRSAGLAPAAASLVRRLKPVQPPVGSIQMYDYDLNAVVQRLEAFGVRRLCLHTTNHAGHYGVMIIGQRAEPPLPSRY